MARFRDTMLAALLIGAGSMASAAAAMPQAAMQIAPPGATQAQYYAPERGYAPAPRYAPQPRYVPQQRRRQVCWNERRRVRVGYDNWGRALYRTYPQRVCRWQYY